MTKIISVTDHVYTLLSKLKGERSFSKMLEEMAQNDIGKGDISKLEPFFGALKKMNITHKLKELKKHREQFGEGRLK